MIWTWYNIVSVISLILSLCGNILINHKKKIGFIVWILSNISWIIVNFMGDPNYPQILMYVVYLILNIIGYCRWNSARKGNKKLNERKTNAI